MYIYEYLKKKYNISKNNANNLVKNNMILVNGIICEKYKYILKINDIVEIHKPKIYDIVYENHNVIVVYKYNNISVSRYFNTPKYEYVLNEEVAKYSNLCKTIYQNEFGIFNRIDKDTRGLVILCKNTDIYYKLLNNKNKITKYYYGFYQQDNRLFNNIYNYFICNHNNLVISNNNICYCDQNIFIPYNIKLLNNPPSISSEGTFTTTYLCKTINGFNCRILSGKTHQIRLHLQYLGYEILGDTIYSKSSRLIHDMYLLNHTIVLPSNLFYQ